MGPIFNNYWLNSDYIDTSVMFSILVPKGASTALATGQKLCEACPFACMFARSRVQGRF